MPEGRPQEKALPSPLSAQEATSRPSRLPRPVLPPKTAVTTIQAPVWRATRAGKREENRPDLCMCGARGQRNRSSGPTRGYVLLAASRPGRRGSTPFLIHAPPTRIDKCLSKALRGPPGQRAGCKAGHRRAVALSITPHRRVPSPARPSPFQVAIEGQRPVAHPLDPAFSHSTYLGHNMRGSGRAGGGRKGVRVGGGKANEKS